MTLAVSLSSVVPTLSLIVRVLALDATGKGVNPARVYRFMFILTVGISVVYLLAMTLTVLLQPFAAVDSLTLMQQQNIWLSPFRGWVSAAIGCVLC